MKELYVVYITRHPLALSRLSVLTAPTHPTAPVVTTKSSTPLLPATHGGGGTYSTTSQQHASNSKLEMAPEMKTYLAKARAIAERFTNAWDLPSLLIKPIQRLLKYPLLLQTLISSTQDTDPTHPDLPNLIEAKRVMEAVARDVNEARRRWEVVKAVLEGYGNHLYTPEVGPLPPGPGTVNGNGAAGSGTTDGTAGVGPSDRPPIAPSSSTSSGLKTFARTINPLSSSTSSSPAKHSRPSTAPTRSSAASSGSGGPGGDDDIVQNPLNRIQSLKTKLKTSLVPTSFATAAAAEEARSATAEYVLFTPLSCLASYDNYHRSDSYFADY